MPHTKPRIPVWLALLGSGLAGTLVAMQSRINGGLSQEIGNGYLAAVVSFGSGLVLLAVLVLVVRRARLGIRALAVEVRAGRYPVWGLLGGLCGAFFVLSQGLVATLLGVAMFTVGIVAGQVVGGLVLDRAGLGPGGRVDPTPVRIIGTLLAVLAVAVSVSSDIGGGARLWLVVVPLLAGAGMAWQSAVNGLVRAASQSAIAATFVNFSVGTTALVLLAAGSIAVNGWPDQWPTQPWFYLGGFIGVGFIALATILVRTAGVLLLSMSNVAGQLVGSVLLEAWLPLAGGVTVGLLIGVGIALVAVVIAALPARPAAR